MVEYLLAGATAVQMGTVNFIHPTAMGDAVDWIAAYCRRHGIAHVSDLVGAMRKHSRHPVEFGAAAE